MRIVLIGAAHPYRGGIAHFVARLYRELSVEHEVRVITFRRQYPRLLFPGRTQIEPAAGPFVVPAERRIDSLAPWTWISAARAVAAGQPDAIVFNYWTPFFAPCFGVMARQLRRCTGARIVFVCHNLLPHERRPGDLLLAGFALRPGHVFLTMSRTVEDDLRARVPAASCVRIHHPAWDSFGLPVPKEEARRLLGIRHRNVILFFGLVRAYKGLHVLLRAMSEADPKLDLLLLVAGEFYEDRTRYEQAIDAAGLRGSVRLDSFYVPSDRVRLYFSAADAVVVPYLRATQSGIAQIAYNFLRPVIASDVEGISEVVVPRITGYLVPAGDAPALAAAIRQFYADGSVERFSEDIRIETQKHSWQAVARAIVEATSGLDSIP